VKVPNKAHKISPRYTQNSAVLWQAKLQFQTTGRAGRIVTQVQL